MAHGGQKSSYYCINKFFYLMNDIIRHHILQKSNCRHGVVTEGTCINHGE